MGRVLGNFKEDTQTVEAPTCPGLRVLLHIVNAILNRNPLQVLSQEVTISVRKTTLAAVWRITLDPPKGEAGKSYILMIVLTVAFGQGKDKAVITVMKAEVERNGQNRDLFGSCMLLVFLLHLGHSFCLV